MTNLGRYTDLPLPSDWIPVLSKLRPIALNLKCSETPDPGVLIDSCFNHLNDRERTIILLRLGRAETLQQIADRFELTRERVRQLEKKALKRLKYFGKELNSALEVYLELCKPSGLVVSTVPDCSSEFAPDYMPNELWLCAFSIFNEWHYQKFDSQPLSSSKWITYSLKKKKQLASNGLSHFLQERRQFVQLEEAAQFLEIEPYDFIHAHTFFEDIF